MIAKKSPSPQRLQILILEDQPSDVELLRHELDHSGFSFTWQQVETKGAYLIALQKDPPFDLILADYNLPQFDALQALQLLQESGLDIPFVVVTGSISETVAVECMKQGAADYLLKSHLKRLGPAVTQVLNQKHLREAQRQAEEAQRQAEAKYRRIFENASEGIFQLTPEGHLLTANPALAQMWGYASSEDLLASPDCGFELHLELTCWAQFKWQMDHNGGVYGFEAQSYRHDGEILWISANARLVRDNRNQILYEGTVEDITDRKLVEQEREALIGELNAFAHTVAHDLKNPLFVLNGTAQFLEAHRAEMSPGELTQCLQTLVRMGRKMNNIVDELLLLAGVRWQEIGLQPLDMGGILHEAQQRLSHLVVAAQAEITTPATWPTALGYAPWVEEVWVNYLSNGLKYGGQSPRLEVGANEAANGQVCFWVRDYGPGLTPEEQARLFTPFTRLNQVQTQGHGLGLSITRRIVEKLGGQVSVESNGMPGEGSIFYFTLPGVPQTMETQ